MTVLLIACGAAVGAPLRYLTDRAVHRRLRRTVPWGTLTVNTVASFVLGIVTGAAGSVSAQVQALVAVGFCGALSTFSTFGHELVTLLSGPERRGLTATAYALGSTALAVGAGALGWVLGAAA